jgi:hypothetical protein
VEAPCLNGICKQLAAFYCLRPGVAALHSQPPSHPDNVQTLGNHGAGSGAAAADDGMEADETAAGAAEDVRAGADEACCRGTCAPRLEQGEPIDDVAEAGDDAAAAAGADVGVDVLVDDARARRKRLHWYVCAMSCVFRFINVWHRLMQHVLLPDIRAFMAPPESMASDGSIIQVRLQARALLLQRNSRGCRLRAPASCTRCSSAADAQQRANKTATCTRRYGVIYIASVGAEGAAACDIYKQSTARRPMLLIACCCRRRLRPCPAAPAPCRQ